MKTPLHRRDFLNRSLAASFGAALLSMPGLRGDHHMSSESQSGPFQLPPLPYDYDALEPHIDARTMRIHHDKHHAGYTRKLNNALKKAGEPYTKMDIKDLLAHVGELPEPLNTAVEQNGGGYWNHTFFWESMSPESGGSPRGELAQAMEDAFGSVDDFRQEFQSNAAGVFGSGWGWLVLDRNTEELKLVKTPNQRNPLMTSYYTDRDVPLLGVDVWEHAYYLKYQNQRGAYLDAFFNVIDWNRVSTRFQEAI
ncbi:MAG: superoxide dismutase [Opitutales bacterium]